MADKTASSLKIKYNTQAKAICPNIDQEGVWSSIRVNTMNGSLPMITYDYVISTQPFSCFCNLDASCCAFDWELSSAIHSCHYDDTTKAAIKFNYKWWEVEKKQIGGASSTDWPTCILVYSSYGIGGLDAIMVSRHI